MHHMVAIRATLWGSEAVYKNTMATTSLPVIWAIDPSSEPLDLPVTIRTMSRIWNNWMALTIITTRLISWLWKF